MNRDFTFCINDVNSAHIQQEMALVTQSTYLLDLIADLLSNQ